MKIITTTFIQITLLGLFLINIVSGANLKSSIKIDVSSDYSISTTPDTIKELVNKIRKNNPADSSAVDECLKLILVSKYETSMKCFWGKVSEIACKPFENLKRTTFVEFINTTNESVKVENIEKQCKSIVISNFQDMGTVESDYIQKELRNIFNVYFSCPTSNKLQTKNIITAFIGPHRGEAQGDLFKKLNGYN
jgi:hypothetical protein